MPAASGGSLSLPLGEGDQGSLVREIQHKLIRAGIALPRYGADGIYGAETEMAVMKFQRRHGLRVDGLVGPQTLGKLNEMLTISSPANEFPLPSGILRDGSEGNGVRQLQRALKQINFDAGAIDGIYGPKTEDAVRRFQETYAELKNDGIYGPNTRKYILMELEEQS
ncbi:peptidoglycan-binding domain-containing protein [Bacillus salacetis]|uniref:peptidoglycan-binding domain-containing protein n=1 Tax=Bacillus salacetis TaxID=2315464 RepID=UPI003BA01D0D